MGFKNNNHVMGLEYNPILCTYTICQPKCVYSLHKCDQKTKTSKFKLLQIFAQMW